VLVLLDGGRACVQLAALHKISEANKPIQGTPVDLAPTHDIPSIAADVQQNQNFDYNHTTPGFNLSSDQTFCPFSAHMRKTRPRADLNNTLDHQILRAGIPYGPEVTAAEIASNTTSIERGLAFGE
jgi:deferrochelatase/peroxidase EfeB